MAHTRRGPGDAQIAEPSEASAVTGESSSTSSTQHSKSPPTPLDVARSYINRGWAPIPVPFREKRPTDKGWQKRTITLENVHRYFDTGPQNVGVQMGPKSGGLADVDLDSREAVALAPYFLPPTPAVFGRASKPRSHHLYKLDGVPSEAVIQFYDPDGEIIVELRIGGGGKGAQTVFPGSTHESDEAIEWNEQGEPPRSPFAAVDAAVRNLAAGSLLMRAWPNEGSRHHGALALGGFLARAGWSDDDIRHFVKAVAAEAGDDEVNDRCR